MLAYAHDVPLASRTTLGVGGLARRFIRVTSVDMLREALGDAKREREPVLILGGGSNLVVRDGGFGGLVVEMGIDARPHTLVESGSSVTLTIGAGAIWDELVEVMVAMGLAGCECLAGIPGLVGATPMQNVGAYGQEVSDTITRVQVLDRETLELVDFTPKQCQFAYRTSVFKGSERWVIVEVDFRFEKRDTSMPIRYAELAKSLGVELGGTAPVALVRERVISLRRGKGMVVDPSDPDSRSAGSFFMNPLVQPSAVPEGAPHWPQPDGRVKVSAAWLIERAGFGKGLARGRVGISSKHALALVNRGGATSSELLALAKEIQDGVRERLGIELHPEPVII